ncbi:MAG: ABC transporter ATP-binding protein [Nocardioides sp.]
MTDTATPLTGHDVTAAAGAALALTGVTKRFGDFVAVDALDLAVPQGSFFALLGPSGCGKTTTLRMVAGLEIPTAGEIVLGDARITQLKPYRRPVNTVFQSYALFPHLTIFENVAFGLRRQRKSNIKASVDEMLKLVELGDLANRRPTQLSGGQQQRVALARALINQPKVLLLDEPLGALDLKLRRQMQIELKRIQTEVGITFVHVTHDQEEAMTMADTVAVMNHGVIEQMGAPVDLYEHPRTTFVANFLGQSNLISGTILGSDDTGVHIRVHGTTVRVPRSRVTQQTGAAWVGIRPEKVAVTMAGVESGLGVSVLRGGVVTDASFIGVSTQYLVRMPWGQELMAFEQNTGVRGPLHVGDHVDLSWAPDHTFLLDARQDANAGVERVDEG